MNARDIKVPGLCFVSGQHLSEASNEQRMRSTVRAVLAARASEQDAIRESHADEVRTGLDSICNLCDPTGFCNTSCSICDECETVATCLSNGCIPKVPQ